MLFSIAITLSRFFQPEQILGYPTQAQIKKRNEKKLVLPRPSLPPPMMLFGISQDNSESTEIPTEEYSNFDKISTGLLTTIYTTSSSEDSNQSEYATFFNHNTTTFSIIKPTGRRTLPPPLPSPYLLSNFSSQKPCFIIKHKNSKEKFSIPPPKLPTPPAIWFTGAHVILTTTKFTTISKNMVATKNTKITSGNRVFSTTTKIPKSDNRVFEPKTTKVTTTTESIALTHPEKTTTFKNRVLKTTSFTDYTTINRPFKPGPEIKSKYHKKLFLRPPPPPPPFLSLDFIGKQKQFFPNPAIPSSPCFYNQNGINKQSILSTTKNTITMAVKTGSNMWSTPILAAESTTGSEAGTITDSETTSLKSATTTSLMETSIARFAHERTKV